MGLSDLFKILTIVRAWHEENSKKSSSTYGLCGAPSQPQTLDFFKMLFFEFCRISRLFLKTKRAYLSVASAREVLVEKNKNFIDESSPEIFQGAQDEQKSKNNYCYKCSN